MTTEAGLSLLESTTLRVTAWRNRHRARREEVLRYVVHFDGATICELEARTKQALDDELAAAAWELAQGLSRPITVDFIAYGADGGEVARLPIRILPAAPVSTATDHTAVISALLKGMEQQQKGMEASQRQLTELMGSVVGLVKGVADLAAAQVQTAHKRAERAESAADVAMETARDATATAADALDSTSRRSRSERLEDMIFDLVGKKAEQVIGVAGNDTTPAAVNE